MKILFLIAVMLLSFTSLNAQSKIIKTEPISLFEGVPSLSFETSINRKNSLQLSALSYLKNDISGFGAAATYNYYYLTSLYGWHTGLSLNFISLKNDYDSVSGFTVGGAGGYQWIFYDYFSIDIYAGVATTLGNTASFEFDNSGFGIGISIGYVW